MRTDGNFQAQYRALEDRMKALAEAQGGVFLPNPRPEGSVHYVFVCMEPSLGGRSSDETRARVRAGYLNFLSSIEDFILHFCVRRYLCKSGERYHITDLSKGAMLVDRARTERTERYERWYPLLEDEINLVATPNAAIVAVGKVVYQYLRRKRLRRPLTGIIHYSGQAGRARIAGVEGHEDAFQTFRDSVSLEDLVATAGDVVRSSGVPVEIGDETLSRLRTSQLTTSGQQLIFIYKTAFESSRGLKSSGDR